MFDALFAAAGVAGYIPSAVGFPSPNALKAPSNPWAFFIAVVPVSGPQKAIFPSVIACGAAREKAFTFRIAAANCWANCILV